MKHHHISLGLAALCAAAGMAREARAEVAVNLVTNGDFTSFVTEDNLWDGVDGSGFLAGWKRGAYAETEAGKVGNQDMPISVSYVDVNGDGLPDLVTADPAGFLRAYINHGTKTEPKFTYAEIIPIFLHRLRKTMRGTAVSGQARIAFQRSRCSIGNIGGRRS